MNNDFPNPHGAIDENYGITINEPCKRMHCIYMIGVGNFGLCWYHRYTLEGSEEATLIKGPNRVKRIDAKKNVDAENVDTALQVPGAAVRDPLQGTLPFTSSSSSSGTSSGSSSGSSSASSGSSSGASSGTSSAAASSPRAELAQRLRNAGMNQQALSLDHMTTFGQALDPELEKVYEAMLKDKAGASAPRAPTTKTRQVPKCDPKCDATGV
jgi:hypothetical protein